MPRASAGSFLDRRSPSLHPFDQGLLWGKSRRSSGGIDGDTEIDCGGLGEAK
jgi:hypothetical protein